MYSISHTLTHNFMSLTERQAFADEIICKIGSVGKIFADCLFHFFNIDRHCRNHITVNSQTEFNRIDSIEEAFFIFLQILIIGQGQAFGRNQHSLQVSVNTTCFAAYKLGNIGIFFLRHHRRTCGKSIIQFNKTKLCA